ncbi:MAG: SpoIIE family protein phosphatase [Clostridia bacterium]
MKNKSKFYNQFIKIIALFCAAYIMSLTSFFGDAISIGALFGVLFSGFNGILTAVLFLGFALSKVATLGFLGLFVVGGICVTLSVIYFFMSESVKGICKYFFADIAIVAYCLIRKITILPMVFDMAVGLAMTFITIYASQFLKSIEDGNQAKFQKIAFCCVVFVFTCGLMNLKIFLGNAFFVFTPFIVVTLQAVFDKKESVIIAILIGLAGYLESQTVGVLLLPITIILICSVFLDVNSFATVFALIATEGVSVFLLNTYGTINLTNYIFYCVSVMMFLLVPKSLLKQYKSRLNLENIEIGRGFVNKGRGESAKKIMELSDIFKQMERMFENMIKGKINGDLTIDLVRNEVTNSICDKCKAKSRCVTEERSKIVEEIETLIATALQRGGVNLLDLPEFLSRNCISANVIMSKINEMTKDILRYNENVESFDSCKAVLSKQFKGVSATLEKLSFEMNADISFDRELEALISDNLKSANIKFDEVFCYYEEGNKPSVLLTLKTKERKGKTIAKLVSKACQMPMVASNAEKGKNKGQMLVSYSAAAKFDVSFGVAVSKKGEASVSGDTNTLTRIANNSFMISLSDGMGSGERAREVSERAIDLVESLYKVGFSDDIVTTTVNNLLSLSAFEAFTAIDICVVDLVNLDCNFIKVGSPPSYVVGEEVTEICGESLPLGILDEVTPTKRRVKLCEGEFIVLMTDGVYDLLGNSALTIIRKNKYGNPQSIADEILKQASMVGAGTDYDDMTVIVGKIFEI